MLNFETSWTLNGRRPMFRRADGGALRAGRDGAGRGRGASGCAAGNILGHVFHPEVSGDDRLHALFLGLVAHREPRGRPVRSPVEVAAFATSRSVAAVGRAGADGSSRDDDSRGVRRDDERPFQVGDDQAQEGGHRRPRGKMFAKLIKNIEVAARTGGGDPDGNPTLFDAIQKAKKSSVPNDNIDRAVKRGSGAEAGGADYQTITYEGYGPNGVAVLIECLTDNRNRAATEVRVAVTRNGGTMADPGQRVLPVHPQGRRDGAAAVQRLDGFRGRPDAGRARRRRRGGQRPG